MLDCDVQTTINYKGTDELNFDCENQERHFIATHSAVLYKQSYTTSFSKHQADKGEKELAITMNRCRSTAWTYHSELLKILKHEVRHTKSRGATNLCYNQLFSFFVELYSFASMLLCVTQ